MIPIERIITEYEEIRLSEKIPIERIIQDYYAVEYQTEYIPRIIEEKVIDYIQQEKMFERVQYLPVETQIIHYPEAELATSQVAVRPVGLQTTQYVTNAPIATVGAMPLTTLVRGSRTVVGGPHIGNTYARGPVTVPYVHGGVNEVITTTTGAPIQGMTTIRSSRVLNGATTYTTTGAPYVGGTTYTTGAPLVGGSTYVTGAPYVNAPVRTYI